jgi:uncharacterized membrane protein YfcA
MYKLLLLWIGFFLFGFLIRYLFSKRKYSIDDWQKKNIFVRQINMVLSVVIIVFGLFTMFYSFLGLISIITGIGGLILADMKADEIIYNKNKINNKRNNKKIDKIIDETQDYFYD